MGICVRVDALQGAAVSSEHVGALGKVAARLVDTAEMGRQHKVMGVMGVTGVRDTEEAWPFTAGEVIAKDNWLTTRRAFGDARGLMAAQIRSGFS